MVQHRFRRAVPVLAVTALLAGAALGQAELDNRQMAGRDEELLPPGAKPGECYARVFVPPTYRTETEKVLLKDAWEKIELVPARWEWVEERVMVEGPSERLEVVPARYDWVEERVLIRPASKKLVEVPAVWETVTEKVLDRPAHTVWKTGRGPLQRVDNATGEIMCLVEVPATYRTVTRRVLKSPATVREVEVPAEYKTVRVRKMVREPEVRKVTVPAKYKTVRVRKMVSPPTEKKVGMPAEYGTVTRRVKVSEGRIEWRPVLCETNATPETIRGIQTRLAALGHDPGPIDGVIGRQTMAAIRSFQKSKGLAEGHLTLETLEALGLR